METNLQKCTRVGADGTIKGVFFALMIDNKEFYFDNRETAEKAYSRILSVGDMVGEYYKNSRIAKERGDENMRAYFLRSARVMLNNLEAYLRQFCGLNVCFGPVWVFVE